MSEILLAILASYFLAITMATLDGPFGLCGKVRERVDPEQRTWVGRGVNCPICVSWWVSLFCAAGLQYLHGVFDPVLFLFEWNGIAGAVTVIHHYLERP